MLGFIMAGITTIAGIGSKFKMDITDHQVRKEMSEVDNPLGLYTDAHGNRRSVYSNKVVHVSRENGDRVIRNSKGQLIQNVDAVLRLQDAYELWKKGVEENPNAFVVKCEKRFSKMGKNWAEGSVYREVKNFKKAYVKRGFTFNTEEYLKRAYKGFDGLNSFHVFGINAWGKVSGKRSKIELENVFEYYMDASTGLLVKLTEECEDDLRLRPADRKNDFKGTKEEADKFLNIFNEKQKKGGFNSFNYYYNGTDYQKFD